MVRVQVTVPPSQDPASVTVTVKHGSVVTTEVPPNRGGSISSRISMDTPREHIGSKYDYTLSGAAPFIHHNHGKVIIMRRNRVDAMASPCAVEVIPL